MSFLKDYLSEIREEYNRHPNNTILSLSSLVLAIIILIVSVIYEGFIK